LHGRRKDAKAARAAKSKADAKRVDSMAQARREPEIVFDSGTGLKPPSA
jgi:hypothetical protein